MKPHDSRTSRKAAAGKQVCELLILPDGRILAHNITRTMAKVFAGLNPADEPMRKRAGLKNI